MRGILLTYYIQETCRDVDVIRGTVGSGFSCAESESLPTKKETLAESLVDLVG
jgi:hypothetical protein